MSEISSLLAREWQNKNQAMRNPSAFASVRLNIKKVSLPYRRGETLFLEQAFSYDLANPYRIRILEILNNKVRTIKLENPSIFANASRDPSKLAKLQEAKYEYCSGCDLFLEREGNGWRGRSVSNGINCVVHRNQIPTYTCSDFYVDKYSFHSLDRGFSLETHEQVWGSRFGHFCFQPLH